VDACIPSIISSDYELMREMMLQLFASGSLDPKERKAQTVVLIEKIKKAYKESEKQPTVKKDVFEAVIEQVTACETRFTESMLLRMESMSNAECVASCIQERDKAWTQFEAVGAKSVDKLYAYFLTYVVQSLCIRFNLKEDEQVIKIDRLDLTGENAGSILAAKEVKADPSRIAIWQPIIGKYHPSFLQECVNAIAWSKTVVTDWLTTGMFQGDLRASPKAKRVVRELSDYKKMRTHGRHVHIDQCKSLGLKITDLEADPTLQDLVLTVHHAFMQTVSEASQVTKIVENQNGVALVANSAVAVR